MKQPPQERLDAATADEPAIQLDGVSLEFPRRRANAPVLALRDMTLSVKPGDIMTVVGPSGCGKTTLLRAIAGLLTAVDDGVVLRGGIRVFGMSPVDAKRKRTFAFTFQNPVLLPWRTVRENVALPLELVVGPDARQDPRVGEMLSLVGIADFAGAMPVHLSGGMQQRANLARALVQEPRVLLMDEPFGSLDEATRERLNFELLRIHRLKAQTILFVTHSLTEAVLLGDRVLVLGPRPATVRTVVDVPLPAPRTDETLLSPDFLALVRTVRGAITGEEDS